MAICIFMLSPAIPPLPSNAIWVPVAMSPEHKSDETVLPSSRFNIFRRALFTAPGLRLHRSLYLAGGSHSLANDIGHYVLSVGALQF